MIWMNRVKKNNFFILNVMRWEKIYFFKGKKKNKKFIYTLYYITEIINNLRVTVRKTISAYIGVIPFVNRTPTYQTLSIIVKIIRIITALTISVIPLSTKRTLYIALPAFMESFIGIISIRTSCIAKIIYQESCS
jgi:hypothetical protein